MTISAVVTFRHLERGDHARDLWLAYVDGDILRPAQVSAASRDELLQRLADALLALPDAHDEPYASVAVVYPMDGEVYPSQVETPAGVMYIQ